MLRSSASDAQHDANYERGEDHPLDRAGAAISR
jgi:hypothetical protein